MERMLGELKEATGASSLHPPYTHPSRKMRDLPCLVAQVSYSRGTLVLV